MLDKEELLDWLMEAYCAESVMDAMDKEHSTTGQTPAYWADKSRLREQAYKQIRKIIKPNAKDEE